MLSGSFQNLLNMGGMPSGLNNAVAGYGYGVDRDDGVLTTPAQRMQREAEIQKLEFDMLKGRQEGKDNLIRGIGTSLVSNQVIPGMDMGNMQGLVAQGQGNFNIMNPFTYGNMNKAVEGTRAGDENIQYSDSPAGQVGEAANERNRLLKQLLEGS
jgi:hypothetical protein